jgi:hypothetical protein
MNSAIKQGVPNRDERPMSGNGNKNVGTRIQPRRSVDGGNRKALT